MAKKSNRNVKPTQVSTAPDPYTKNSGNLGKMMGAVCLLVFICFEQLWIGTLACALAFGVLCVIQVFVEKSRTLFTSAYLYAAAGTAVLAFLEWQNHFISNLLGL